MWLFDFFKAIYRKIMWVVDFIKDDVYPIYAPLVQIIKDVGNTDLENDEARREVFNRITQWIKDNAPWLKISDSRLNTIIELVYMLVKHKKD